MDPFEFAKLIGRASGAELYQEDDGSKRHCLVIRFDSQDDAARAFEAASEMAPDEWDED